MEENSTVTTGNQQETAGSNAEVQDNRQEKMFTQEEVNGFVQSRIGRLRGQIEKEARAEYDKKLAELAERERKLMVKERLQERNMPQELADIITCTDAEDLDKKLESLNAIYGRKEEQKESTGFMQVGNGGDPKTPATHKDPIREAMGL